MTSKRGLQICLAILAVTPLLFGLLGLVFGADRLSDGLPVSPSLDSQFRFMSGWYLALAGIALWIIPRIETETQIFRIVCACLFVGGLARIVSGLQMGWPQPVMIAGTVVELLVPLLVVWQHRVATRARAVGSDQATR